MPIRIHPILNAPIHIYAIYKWILTKLALSIWYVIRATPASQHELLSTNRKIFIGILSTIITRLELNSSSHLPSLLRVTVNRMTAIMCSCNIEVVFFSAYGDNSEYIIRVVIYYVLFPIEMTKPLSGQNDGKWTAIRKKMKSSSRQPSFALEPG